MKWYKFLTPLALLAILSLPSSAANDKNYTYLALGDSVSFGLDIRLVPLLPPASGTKLPSPAAFIGYPVAVANALHLSQSKKFVDASCPGQSSASFLNKLIPDIGCELFKKYIGLHTTYSGSQAAFAVAQLQTNRNINLVTLNLGGNDLSMLQASCPLDPNFSDCVTAGLNTLLPAYGANLGQILYSIRVLGGYQGELVLLTQYSPSADLLFQGAVTAVNTVLKNVAAPFGAKIADGFAAFNLAAVAINGGTNLDPCQAGLVIRLTSSPLTCDIHPSPLGHDILAATILAVIGDHNNGGEANDSHAKSGPR